MNVAVSATIRVSIVDCLVVGYGASTVYKHLKSTFLGKRTVKDM